ncbi:uncharacterized protein LY79DRAFT_548370 [Colletotrichum navitas]|uniref:Uncharacterized protein n=1 Tax=Colletotrichum navitas TaxID=681940 RepID=A0AAD8V7T6_9PEZI|nr:uncharacterized protein LY79DRAFT_548370 [Colletotrichum navitas]KAK1594755.1 hypothetical protein LY79DRAFT_548370 [Colletotrichum navitas]
MLAQLQFGGGGDVRLTITAHRGAHQERRRRDTLTLILATYLHHKPQASLGGPGTWACQTGGGWQYRNWRGEEKERGAPRRSKLSSRLGGRAV